MDSRDNDKLIVTKDAVSYAYSFLNEVYSSPALKYLEYSATYAENAYSDEDLGILASEFKSKFPYEWQRLCSEMYFTVWIKASELSSIAPSIDTKYVREMLGYLAGKKLLESTSRNAYTKTPIGVKFLELLLPDTTDITPKTAEEVLEGLEYDEF